MRSRENGSPDATRAVDWEQRIDFPRLRRERLILENLQHQRRPVVAAGNSARRANQRDERRFLKLWTRRDRAQHAREIVRRADRRGGGEERRGGLVREAALADDVEQDVRLVVRGTDCCRGRERGRGYLR